MTLVDKFPNQLSPEALQALEQDIDRHPSKENEEPQISEEIVTGLGGIAFSKSRFDTNEWGPSVAARTRQARASFDYGSAEFDQ